jgi:6-phosphogluconolactonase
MRVEVLADPESVAQRAATVIAAEARAAIAERGKFVVALSGGHTPWIMLRALAREDLPWESLLVVQVDERVAPDGDPDRNLMHVRECLIGPSPLRLEQIYAMPVEPLPLDAAARYALTLGKLAGLAPILELVHLGLGPDGHTASLVPGDAALDVTAVDVTLTDVYQGRRRMTLTYPIINRSRRILWLVTGGEKAAMLARLRNPDMSIPAGRIRQEQAVILADFAAAGQSGPNDDQGRVATTAS